MAGGRPFDHREQKAAIEVFNVLARWLLSKQKRPHTPQSRANFEGNQMLCSGGWQLHQYINKLRYADMAELVDALDLGSSVARRDGFESLYPHQ